MIDDLLSLRIVLLLDGAADRSLLRQGAAAASTPVDLLEPGSTGEACELVSRSAVDVVFASASLPAADRLALVSRVRATQRPPFLFLVSASREAAGSVALNGADAAIVLPTDPDEMRRLVDRCGVLRDSHNVLIVDDSQTMRSIVRKILNASRFHLQLAEASEAVAAMQQIETGRTDLVFLDYNMPGLNGIEALSEMQRRFPEVRVVVMTGTDDAGLAQRAQQAGAAAFLKKPFYPADIDAVLQRIFGLQGIA